MVPQTNIFVEAQANTHSDSGYYHHSVQVHCIYHWTLQWRHNERDGVSNHRRLHVLLNRLFRCESNINAPHHWPLGGEFTGDREKCFHVMTSSIKIFLSICTSALLTSFSLKKSSLKMRITRRFAKIGRIRKYQRRPKLVVCMIIHYNDVIMGAIASQITSLKIVYSNVYSDADQRKHQISKWPVTRKLPPFDDVIMQTLNPQRIRMLSPTFTHTWFEVLNWVQSKTGNGPANRTGIRHRGTKILYVGMFAWHFLTKGPFAWNIRIETP